MDISLCLCGFVFIDCFQIIETQRRKDTKWRASGKCKAAHLAIEILRFLMQSQDVMETSLCLCAFVFIKCFQTIETQRRKDTKERVAVN